MDALTATITAIASLALLSAIVSLMVAPMLL